MSLKDKASKIDFQALAAVPSRDGTSTPIQHRPKTAPGMLMAQSTDQRSALLRENEELKTQVAELSSGAARASELSDELKAWDGAKATRLIDPALIRRSRWANRDPKSFQSESFQQLKSEISAAGGNVQAVKVRPIRKAADSSVEFEIVFGHRRHQACLELGLPVLAMVDNLDDATLFAEMDRENRTRKDLSAWEQGMMYRRALDEKLFPSNRRLADAVGADLTNVGRALALASLPEDVVAAFESPLDLQFRWARPLQAAFDADPAAVRKVAKSLPGLNPRPTAKAVFEALTGDPKEGGSTLLPPQPVNVLVAGKRAAVISVNARGGAAIMIEPGLVPADRLDELARIVGQFLEAPARREK